MEREVFLIYLFLLKWTQIVELAIMWIKLLLLGSLKRRRNWDVWEIQVVMSFHTCFNWMNFTHQTTCLFCDIFTSTALLCRFASYGFLSENERGQNKMWMLNQWQNFCVFIGYNFSWVRFNFLFWNCDDYHDYVY